jgi:hypothetical protein
MESYGPRWEKCSRCGTTASDVKEGKCADQERCLRYAVRKSDREFELRIAEDRANCKRSPK